MIAFLLLIVAGFACIPAYVTLLRWKTFGRRIAQPLRVTYDREDLLHTIAFDEFSEVMQSVAYCYSVVAEKLQLNDSFKRELAAVDSWMLGKGSEQLAKFLTVKYPELKFDGIVTIRDMLISIGKITNH